MSQSQSENDDNSSVVASDFVQLDQQADFVDEEVPIHHQEHPQFGSRQNSLDWTIDIGSTSTRNDGKDLNEMKWMVANLQVVLRKKIIYLYCLIHYLQAKN
jgi:hypothetical protein